MDAACATLIETVTGFPTSDHRNVQSSAQSGDTESRTVKCQRGSAVFSLARHAIREPLTIIQGAHDAYPALGAGDQQYRGKVVEPVQLEAAVPTHDIRMMLLPEATWLKVGKMNDTDKALLRNHPGYAAGPLLQRMTGWGRAAEIVAQHHEMPDGGGYPNQLAGEQICPGTQRFWRLSTHLKPSCSNTFIAAKIALYCAPLQKSMPATNSLRRNG